MFWSLAKVVDEADGGIALQGIFDAENIDVALVEKMMKHINGLNCGRSLLFEAENPVKNQKIGMMYSDAYQYIVTFGQNSSKLNSRPVYCSRVYGTQIFSSIID